MVINMSDQQNDIKRPEEAARSGAPAGETSSGEQQKRDNRRRNDRRSGNRRPRRGNGKEGEGAQEAIRQPDPSADVPREQNKEQSKEPNKEQNREPNQGKGAQGEKGDRRPKNERGDRQDRNRRNRRRPNKDNRRGAEEAAPTEEARVSLSESYEEDVTADAMTEEVPETMTPPPEDVLSEEPPAVPDNKTPVEIVGIRFKTAGKVYYFDPDGGTFKEDETVIVETARGPEYGFVVTPNRTVMASDIVSPLKKILRRADESDRLHYEENNRRREEAFAICQEKIAEHGIDMKLVDVEYTFDNSKLLFYFTADGRVDFRELVKDLASIFRTRIELRQIGIRDEAKLMGGLGVCGRPLCCHSFLSDFVQVSIKMAKEQNLSLNSAKISGTCGRLMCCLRYEYDVYEEEIKKTPKMDAVVKTPDGEAVVCEVIPLAGMIRVRFVGAKSDTPPKLLHRDQVKVIGKMNWKSGNITYYDTAKTEDN